MQDISRGACWWQSVSIKWVRWRLSVIDARRAGLRKRLAVTRRWAQTGCDLKLLLDIAKSEQRLAELDHKSASLVTRHLGV